MKTEVTDKNTELDSLLLKELEDVIAHIQNNASKHDQTASLALLRLVRHLTLQEWQNLSLAAGAASDWLAVPLQMPAANALDEFLQFQQELIRQRDHDGLTGIFNRRYFDKVLKIECERALRTRNELSLIILDLDNFKNINDLYGHACGDTVLQCLASLMKASCRAYDTASRIGGEEFALLLPAASCWAAKNTASKLLEKFREKKFQCGTKHFSVTFSGGIAAFSMLDKNKSAEELFNTADQALYSAKNSGKNTVLITQTQKTAEAVATLVRNDEKQLLFSS